MEILINGRVWNEPDMPHGSSFPQLMTEINKILGHREEIITDLKADGLEIVSWDVAELDVAQISRLEIQTLAAHEYAILSLGDLGEYTGEVLSVLRNVENISGKRGFEHVRQQIFQGLDYMMAVIETSGKVLHLKLDKSRYDMRTGEQMMKELVSLKSKIAAAQDVAAAKRHFEELELTLTDWLKFLEVLLQRYGDKQVEVGDRLEILDHAKNQGAVLDRLEAAVKGIVDDLYAGKLAKSMDQFQSKILTLQESLVYLQRLKDAGRIQYHMLTVKDEALSDKIPQMAKILKELSDSIQIGDSVLMRDLLEYEILPFISYLRQIYGQIAVQQEKE